MRIELNRRANLMAFAAVSLTLAALYFYWTLNHYRASRYAEDLSQASLEMAVRLEPNDAEHRDMLARFYLYALQDPGRAHEQLLLAVRSDPYNSRYWLDLATAAGLLEKTDEQREALRSALRVDPKTPKVAWEAGNFFLADGDLMAALDSFRTVLLYDPVALHPAVDLSWRATHDVQMVLAHAIPPKIDPHLELMRILADQNRAPDVMAAWRAMVRINEPFKVADAMPLVDYMIREHQVGYAQEMWASMARQSPSLKISGDSGNLIVNGDFEEEIIPGGFSWRLQPPASQTIRVDTREVRRGTSSLAFNFEGPAFDDYGFSQMVPVKAKQTYELRVSAKSQEIRSADGPRIMVEDAFSHAPLAKGDEWQGTHGWDEQKILFTTKPDTALVRIYLGRAAGTGLIRGTLWIDKITMFER